VVTTEYDLAGTVLEGRYQVGELIAVGGMSRVYRGTDTRLDRSVAIKVMDSRLAADARFRGRFEREARAIARIDHPCVVGVFDQGEDAQADPGRFGALAGLPPRGDAGPQPLVYLVMELVTGGTLRDVLTARGALDLPTALAVLEPVLAALAAAHAQGLTHRDVKPENVLISESGAVKVADFGLVTAAAQAHASTAGLILGTVAYLSPEQVTGRPVDARADVYAAGVVLYELLTGGPPFGGDHPLAVAYQHVNTEVPPPSARVPGLPGEIDALVLSATRREPDARPPDAAAFLNALLSARVALGIPRVPVPVPRAAGRAHGPIGPATAKVHQGVRPGSTRALTALTPAGPRKHRHRFAGAGDPGLGAPYDEHLRRRRRGRQLLAVWLGIVLLLGLLVGAAAWNAGAGRFTVAPRVLGMDEASAVAAERTAGLVPVVVRAHHDTIPAGRVAASDPPGDRRVSRGGKVTLTVSTGRPTVPPIPFGASVAQAQQILRAAGLLPSDVTIRRSDPDAPEGTVIGTNPAEGSRVTSGAKIALVLSSGPEKNDDGPAWFSWGRGSRDREADQNRDWGSSLSDEIENQIRKALGG
jgi:serine/threonine-protein kinase